MVGHGNPLGPPAPPHPIPSSYLRIGRDPCESERRGLRSYVYRILFGRNILKARNQSNHEASYINVMWYVMVGANEIFGKCY